MSRENMPHKRETINANIKNHCIAAVWVSVSAWQLTRVSELLKRFVAVWRCRDGQDFWRIGHLFSGKHLSNVIERSFWTPLQAINAVAVRTDRIDIS